MRGYANITFAPLVRNGSEGAVRVEVVPIVLGVFGNIGDFVVGVGLAYVLLAVISVGQPIGELYGSHGIWVYDNVFVKVLRLCSPVVAVLL